MVILKLKKICNLNGLWIEDWLEMRWILEQVQWCGVVVYQQVFGLLIGIQCYFVCFLFDVGLFIVVECCMCWVDMIVVGLYVIGFNVVIYVIGEVGILCLYFGVEIKLGFIGDSQCFCFVFKGGYFDYWFKDFFLEGMYIVVIFNQCGLNIKVIIQCWCDSCLFVFGQNLFIFFLGNLNIGEDFVELLVGSLSVDYGVGI